MKRLGTLGVGEMVGLWQTLPFLHYNKALPEMDIAQ